MPRRFIELLIDAVDDIERFLTGDDALDRASHHHTLQANLIEVGVEGLRCLDRAAGLQHHLHTAFTPGHDGGILLRGPGQSGTLHAEANGAAGDVPIPATVDRIEFEQMRCRRSITGGIIDVHQFDAGAPPKGPETPNARSDQTH